MVESHLFRSCGNGNHAFDEDSLLPGSSGSLGYVASSAERAGRDCGPADPSPTPDRNSEKPSGSRSPAVCENPWNRLMRTVRKMGFWFDWLRHSRTTHDFARDWRRWSTTERIAASLLAASLNLAPVLVYAQ
jgi:hypothetical protein